MKKLALILIIMTLVVSSAVLIVNHQTDQGLLKNSNRNYMNSTVSTKPSKDLTKGTTKEAPKVNIKEKKQVRPKKVKKDIVVTIDPGHQEKANMGQEPVAPKSKMTKFKATVGSRGAITKKSEYAITLDASKMLQKKLQKKGYKVFLTRYTNEVDLSNIERAKIANKRQSSLFIRIHADGAENPNVHGFSIIAPGKDNPYTKKVFRESKIAAQTIVKQVEKDFVLYQNGLIYRSDLAGFNWSKVPVILVELGYISNPQEDRNLSNSHYLDKLSTSISDGVSEYLDKTK